MRKHDLLETNMRIAYLAGVIRQREKASGNLILFNQKALKLYATNRKDAMILIRPYLDQISKDLQDGVCRAELVFKNDSNEKTETQGA